MVMANVDTFEGLIRNEDHFSVKSAFENSGIEFLLQSIVVGINIYTTGAGTVTCSDYVAGNTSHDSVWLYF